MTAILGVLASVALLAAVWWRVERLIRDRNARQLAIEEGRAAVERQRVERELAIEERKLALEVERQSKPAPPVAIPGGLLMIAARESEEWAREQIKTRMRELYAECGDWNMVGQLIAQEAHGTFGEIDA